MLITPFELDLMLLYFLEAEEMLSFEKLLELSLRTLPEAAAPDDLPPPGAVLVPFPVPVLLLAVELIPLIWDCWVAD